MNRRTFLFASLALTATANTAYAGDDALYADVFDPNSSFIRVLAPGETFASIDGKTIPEVE